MCRVHKPHSASMQLQACAGSLFAVQDWRTFTSLSVRVHTGCYATSYTCICFGLRQQALAASFQQQNSVGETKSVLCGTLHYVHPHNRITSNVRADQKTYWYILQKQYSVLNDTKIAYSEVNPNWKMKHKMNNHCGNSNSAMHMLHLFCASMMQHL